LLLALRRRFAMGSLVPGWGAVACERCCVPILTQGLCGVASTHRARAPADEKFVTADEHTRDTSVFREQLEAARRSASPPAHEDSEKKEQQGADTATEARRDAQPAASLPRKQRSSSLPPAERRAEHRFFDDSISWWRGADAGGLNAPPSRQAARASAPPQAMPLGDAVEAAARGRELPPTPPVWRDETGALHRRPSA
jgi:hypothetical protein